MISLFVIVLAFVLLCACWYMGDLEFRTKAILTLVYLATWIVYAFNGWALTAAQALLALILWWTTFGPTRR